MASVALKVANYFLVVVAGAFSVAGKVTDAGPVIVARLISVT
jgi:hypothetical protein